MTLNMTTAYSSLMRESDARSTKRVDGGRQAEERHAGQERQMLTEVDRARQASNQFETGLAKE